MKSLMVYYSRSGQTAKIARELADTLKCDVEEIIDTKKRSGILGCLRSGSDAMKKSLTVLERSVNYPAEYDLILIGTPNWAGHVSSPVRTYIHQNQAKFKELAFFCTAGSNDFAGPFNDMHEISGKSPVATLGVRGKKINDGSYKSEVQEFIKTLPVNDI